MASPRDELRVPDETAKAAAPTTAPLPPTQDFVVPPDANTAAQPARPSVPRTVVDDALVVPQDASATSREARTSIPKQAQEELTVPSDAGATRGSRKERVSAPRAQPESRDVVMIPINATPEEDDDHHYVPVSQLHPQEVNRFQTVGQVAYRITINGIPAAFVLLETLPRVAEPYNSMLISGYAVLGYAGANAFHTLFNTPHPFENFDWRNPVANFVSAIPALGAGYGMGCLVEDVLPQIAPSNYQLLLLLINPLVKVAGISLVGTLAYGLTKLMARYFLRVRDAHHENEDLSAQQVMLNNLFKMVEAVFVYESIRNQFIFAGDDAALRNKYFPLLVAGLYELLNGLNYIVQNPRPFDNLVPREQWPRQSSHADLPLLADEVKDPPTNKQIGSSITRHLGKAGLAIGFGAFLGLEVYDWATRGSDQEKESIWMRNGRLYSLVALTICAEPLAKKAYDVGVSLASRCCIFGRNKAVAEVGEQQSLLRNQPGSP